MSTSAQARGRAARAIALAALAASALAGGCVTPAPYTIHLASPDERLPRPRFSIVQHSHDDGPFYYRVDLWERQSGVRSWRALSDSFAARPAVLVYGELEGTWKVEAGPLPLEEGKQYMLEIVGEGDGNIRFRVEPGGKVVEGW